MWHICVIDVQPIILAGIESFKQLDWISAGKNGGILMLNIE